MRQTSWGDRTQAAYSLQKGSPWQTKVMICTPNSVICIVVINGRMDKGILIRSRDLTQKQPHHRDTHPSVDSCGPGHSSPLQAAPPPDICSQLARVSPHNCLHTDGRALGNPPILCSSLLCGFSLTASPLSLERMFQFRGDVAN